MSRFTLALFLQFIILLLGCGEERQAEESDENLLEYGDEVYYLPGVRDTSVNVLELEFYLDVFLNGQPYQLFILGTEDDIRPVLVPVVNGVADYDQQLTFTPENVEFQSGEGVEYGNLEDFLSGGGSTIFKKRSDKPPPVNKSM